MAISHAGHNHPATPAGRRACRAATGGVVRSETPVRKLAEAAGLVKPRNFRELRDAHAAGRAKDVRPARIQPKRSGARVAIDNSGCVQAALHTGRGRCACGWDTMSA